MAEPQLFDVSSLDLSQVAVSAEEVGRINPQCGDMRQLDHVIWLGPGKHRILGVKVVTEEEFWVPLHIPGRPLMPGVLIIEAAAQLCSVLFRQKCDNGGFLGFARCDEVSFRGQVVPGDVLYLLGEEITFKPRRLVCRTQGIVNGKIVFGAKITGLVI